LLRFKLLQVYIPSLGRYFLPLPKLSEAQLSVLRSHLQERGFALRSAASGKRLTASKATQRISIDRGAGLAASSSDLLDALGPAMPRILGSRGRGEEGEEQGKTEGEAIAARYFSLKKGSGESRELQFFPRMESLSTWTCLRRDGLSGLTPDEAAVLRHVFGGASSSSRLDCVTAKPREGSLRLQVGRNLYYASNIPVLEFLSTLRTIDKEDTESASYLPRESVFRLKRTPLDSRLRADDVGEWFSFG
jgi:hypothetical protein